MLLNQYLELARRAHLGTSFVPEQRSREYIEAYSAELTEDLSRLPESLRSDYEERYKRHFSAWLSAKSNCISTMITGGSNFPVRRAEKANKSEQNRYEEFTSFRKKYFERLARNERREQRENTDPLAEMREKLAEAEKMQSLMVAANKIISKKLGAGEKIANLTALGFSEAVATELLEPDCFGRPGFAPYKLQNNNANIRRMRQRVVELETKAAKQTIEANVDGIRIVENADADRLQIFFPGKPAPEKIAALKKRAFKWSPSNGCWQRQLTENARYAAKQILASL